MSQSPLPDLCSAGHTLIITLYPPSLSGVSVVMRNLLSPFHSASFSIATIGNIHRKKLEVVREVNRYTVMSTITLSGRFNAHWRDLQVPWSTWRVTQLIRQLNPRVVVCVFPYYHLLKVARDATKATQTPWIAYLHDTLAEMMSTSRLAAKAQQLQEQVFAETSSLLVMSQGMADLYRERYGLVCKPLEHSYPEPIPDALSNGNPFPQAFWSGGIYEINGNALSRVSAALRHNGTSLHITGKTEASVLRRYGITGNYIHTAFYPRRQDYLDNLRKQGLLILALDWPDETSVHPDELATIFPTKTPEYLATGRPILVHCPEHYFLARFFRERGCGLIVSERSEDALRNACHTLLADDAPDVRTIRQSALEAAQLFALDRVAGVFQREVEAVSQVQWGQKAT
jgi:glycosyltransferase involved in cell wall biosynthesis